MMMHLDEENASSAAVGVCYRDGDQQLLLQNEYLIAENRILRSHLPDTSQNGHVSANEVRPAHLLTPLRSGSDTETTKEIAHHSSPTERSTRGLFTVEVLTWRGLATYYVLFFLHLERRRVTVAGITQHPTEEWMVQMARNAVDVIDGTLLPVRYALHDRDTKFCSSFQMMLRWRS
ncbi:MAG: hypothetical protein ACJ746_15875 [Bryobacteraceae bacterium]